ncbi:MAG: hypothetical protein ABW023_07965 [Sphingomonas sp.]
MFAFALLLTIAQDRSSIVPSIDDEPPAGSATARCGQTSDEITVCGNTDQSRFRALPLEQRYAEKPIRSQFALPGGATGSVHADQRSVGGISVPAAMITLRIPLGGKKKATEPDPQ